MIEPQIIIERKKYGSSAAMDYTMRVYQKLNEETIMIDGVKYQKVEEQKPQTLLEIILDWWVQDWTGDSKTTCEQLVNRIEKEWLPDEMNDDGEEYHYGWNDCLNEIKKNLR